MVKLLAIITDLFLYLLADEASAKKTGAPF